MLDITPSPLSRHHARVLTNLFHQSGDKTKPRGPQHATEDKKAYANRHFDKTNADAMTHAEVRLHIKLLLSLTTE
jgi:hypothetical protein